VMPGRYIKRTRMIFETSAAPCFSCNNIFFLRSAKFLLLSYLSASFSHKNRSKFLLSDLFLHTGNCITVIRFS
jgi:hypothetical protein